MLPKPSELNNVAEGTDIVKIFFTNYLISKITPNGWTTIRVFCTLANLFLLYYFVHINYTKALVAAFISTLIAAFSDWADGRSACINNLKSTFGAVYDRYADKAWETVNQKIIWLFPAWLAFEWFDPVWTYFKVTLISFFFISEAILIHCARVEKKLKINPGSGDSGKMKTGIRYLSSLLFLFILLIDDDPSLHRFLSGLAVSLQISSHLFAVWSIKFHKEKIKKASV